MDKKTLKPMILKDGLNNGLHFPKLGASTVILGKCNIFSTFGKHSFV